MTERHKQMCGCETCTVLKLNHDSFNRWRRLRLKRMKNELNRMRAGRAKDKLQKQYDDYKREVQNDDDDLYPKLRDALCKVICPPSGWSRFT